VKFTFTVLQKGSVHFGSTHDESMQFQVSCAGAGYGVKVVPAFLEVANVYQEPGK